MISTLIRIMAKDAGSRRAQYNAKAGATGSTN
jgi:hypothetical protein